ncbi:D,D-dipeptide ABC transporter permease, partial [Escherichia coli]|nr:D,D-dipeptide ABC transporter permease [Escherichia coli]
MSGAWTLTRGLLKNPLGALGLALTLLVVLGGLFAPLIAPYDPLRQDILARLSGPSAQHWL